MTLNDLIGIQYKFGRHDMKKCGCHGIVYLYFKHIRNTFIPFSDGKIVLPFSLRNRAKDPDRIEKAYKEYTEKVITKFDDLRENDIMLYGGLRHDYAVGVIVDKTHCLTASRKVGTYLMHYPKFKKLFIKGFRLFDEKK